MTVAEIRRRIITARENPGKWVLIEGDEVHVRFVEGFPRGRFSLVRGWLHLHSTITNTGEATASSITGAVREARRLLQGEPDEG